MPSKSNQTILSHIPAGWCTKPEALKITRKALKTFEQAVKAQGIKSRLLENPGKRPTPIYKRSDVQTLFKPRQTTALTVRGPQGLTRRPQAIAPPPPAKPILSSLEIAHMHLVTTRQAHALGYPLTLLRQLKKLPNPPGYGSQSGFRFSVAALQRWVDSLG